MDGIEATIRILNLYEQIKIVFATADSQIREKALDVGACSVIEKPFKLDLSITTLNNMLFE